MQDILYVIVLFLPTILFLLYLTLFDRYDRTKRLLENTSPILTFEKFISLYNAAPQKWELLNGYAVYDGDPICFHTYLDFRQYTKWAKKVMEKAQDEENKKTRDSITDAWDLDIKSTWI